MNTFFNTATYQTFVQRIGQLSATSKPLWGKMTVGQMLHHLNLALGCSIGKHALADESNFLSRSIVKWSVLYVLPRFLTNLPTGKTITVSNPKVFEEEQISLLNTLAQMQQQTQAGVNGMHPLFGKLNGKEWGVLAYKHLDHHLRQFGV